jgi:ABC-type dipeptide/oligopeptide/nickel transport system ATPase component
MLKKRKIILIFGRTGSGKSYLAKRLIEKFERVVIIDKMYEYQSETIFYNFNDLIEYYLKNVPDTFNFVCRFENDNDIELLFKFCWYVKNVLLVVEESELYISPYQKQSEFLKLVRYGRHRAISIIAIARRVVELSNDVKANADEIISFKQILKKDIDYLKQLGFTKVENLKQYDFEVINY